MDHFSLIVVLLLGVVLLAAMAQRLRIPYPIVMIASGLVIAITPVIPGFELDPHLALVIFLPLVLFEAAFHTSLRDFRTNLPSIGGLAIGGVLVTTVVTALVSFALFEAVNWPMAFAIGAIVSPPDAVAAMSVLRRVGAPHRVQTILEGESLVNDATALTTYRFAVVALVGGSFSLAEASGRFVIVMLGGIAMGLSMAWVCARVIERLNSPDLEIGSLLLIPFAIYTLAERFHVSGVLAVVAAGMYLGRHSSRIQSSESLVGARFTWQAVLILMNGLAFVLMGMQMRYVLDGMDWNTTGEVITKAVVIGMAVIVARFMWVIPATWLLGTLRKARHKRPVHTRASTFVIGWSGLRGVVTLATAMALPLTLDTGEPLPMRTEVIFIAFVVIVMTLAGQGMMLPFFVRRFGLTDANEQVRDIWRARRIVAEAATIRLAELTGEAWVPRSNLEAMMARYEQIADEIVMHDDPVMHMNQHGSSVRQLRQEVVESGRRSLDEAAALGLISEPARQVVESELTTELIRPIS